MKSRKSLSSVPNSHKHLPEDTMVHILSLLPVKSLFRFMCVCKLWFQIINSKSFENYHLKNSSNTKKYLIFEHFGFYSLHGEQSTIYKPSKIIRHHYTPELFEYPNKYRTRILVHGNCNGVLCLSDSYLKLNSRVCLWNPMIRKAKTISLPSNYDEFLAAYLCFGYYDDDYKVILIVFLDTTIYRLEVYSLKTDNWKLINTTEFIDIRILMGYRCPYAWILDGAAYFGFWGKIVCFNLFDERIREISYPEKFSLCVSNKVEAYGDTLAFMKAGAGYFSMWVLRNCGKPSSSWWEKKFTIDFPSGDPTHPLGFEDKGKYMLKTTDGRFYSCNLEIPKLNCIRFRLKLRNLLRLGTFVESLALLDEKTIGPSEPEPCSSYPAFRLHKTKTPNKKRKVEETTMEKD